ncbi:hypothetical protein [Allohahella sp. A8]|uniref:hypothetical protein n=1 Tax=Allohahella sp. A8 TaxID=3141461 RepID=UPI003A7FC6A7
MDYQNIDGVWQHPERKLIFLGDLVDRGPEQVETVQIAKAMVEHGHALAVMGTLINQYGKAASTLLTKPLARRLSSAVCSFTTVDSGTSRVNAM